MTTRLSVLSDFSIRYPVKNSRAGPRPWECRIHSPKATESPIQSALHAAASPSDIRLARRCASPRSSASNTRTQALNPIQSVQLPIQAMLPELLGVCRGPPPGSHSEEPASAGLRAVACDEESLLFGFNAEERFLARLDGLGMTCGGAIPKGYSGNREVLLGGETRTECYCPGSCNTALRLFNSTR